MTSTLPPPTSFGLDDGEHLLVCRAVIKETHDVRSFVLASVVPTTLDFAPGQYLTLTLDVAGAQLSRCYTISSSPHPAARTDDTVTITVKRVPGGPVSNHLHDRFGVGDTVVATGPLGVFSHTHHPAARYLMLSAGSGITPSMSMLRTLALAGEPLDVVFVHHARTPADLVFRAELEALAAAVPGVRVEFVCEADGPGPEAWAGRRGRLDLATVREVVPDAAEREVFTCGPAPYMAVARQVLALVGADPARCHEESFVLGAGAPVVPAPAPGTGEGAGAGTAFAVEFRRSGRTVSCPVGTSLLAAAAEAGLSLPSSCGEGVCGTCKTDLLEGSVDMQAAGGIRPREVAAGKVLLCCSTPESDLTLDA